MPSARAATTALTRPRPVLTSLRRGDVVYVRFESSVGSEISTDGKPEGRPSVVLSTDRTYVARVVPISDAAGFQSALPFSVPVTRAELGLGGKDSVIACGSVDVVDWSRINHARGVWTRLGPARMEAVDVALRGALGMPER